MHFFLIFHTFVRVQHTAIYLSSCRIHSSTEWNFCHISLSQLSSGSEVKSEKEEELLRREKKERKSSQVSKIIFITQPFVVVVVNVLLVFFCIFFLTFLLVQKKSLKVIFLKHLQCIHTHTSREIAQFLAGDVFCMQNVSTVAMTRY